MCEVMPLVPKTLSILPFHSGSISVDDGYNTDYVNAHSSSFMNDFNTDITTRELEEITHTLQVDMVSQNFNTNDLSSPSITPSTDSSSTVRNCESNCNLVCGVIIVDERISTRIVQNGDFPEHHYKNAIVLGSVILGRNNYTGEELRRCMQSQLPSVPQKFTFLTKEGWPLLRNQENKINASNLINSSNIIAIRKSFDKPRVGIVNTHGECFGFIFVEYHFSLRQIRDIIDEQLKEIGAKSQKWDYKFLERNGWPVSPSQELLLHTIDIIVNHNICIQISGNVTIANALSTSTANVNAISQEQPPYALPAPIQNLQPQFVSDDRQLSVLKNQDAIDSTDGLWRRKGSGKTKTTFLSIRGQTQRRKEKVTKPKVSNPKEKGKPIMISYSRQEAAQHALDLKKQLVNNGFSVYLDVHEIQNGSDWQDSLNDAVYGCDVFVPLVTPMYGKTQWTNREVKLADVLKKCIIPINFLDEWPPACLAIQLATTQYIHWIPPESEHQSNEKKLYDIKVWNQSDIEKVSKLLSEQINVLSKQISTSKILPEPTTKPIPMLMSQTIQSEGIKLESDEKSLIVISAHPQQKHIVSEIKTALIAEGYNVWCSTDLPEGGLLDDDVFNNVNTPPFTPNQLPTIREEKETAFSDAYKDIARRIVETSKQRPLSLPPGAETQLVEARRSSKLTRMLSAGSDGSGGHLCSLTPEKMGHLKIFRDNVSSAGLVLMIASETYLKSLTSQQHVFYCERRKKLILVRCDNLENPPGWFTMLMGNDIGVNVKHPRFMDVLKAHIKRKLDPSAMVPNDDNMHESKMQYLINFMKRNLPVLETCVYVVGSTKLQNPRSEEICKAIGTELAKVKNVQIVTSGFYGAGDLVAKSFNDARQSNRVPTNLTSINSPANNTFDTYTESSVVHILPVKDSQDFSSKCRQNADGSFEAMPYGKTLFLGESVKERESAVARLLDTCILIEGGPGAAREIEDFIWNDHFVIPVISTGGAASGQYDVPLKIFDCPHGVSEKDWDMLSDNNAEPIEVAKAIVRIVMALKDAIANHALSRLEIKSKPKTKVRRSTKKKFNDSKRKVDINAANAGTLTETGEPNSPDKILPVIEEISASREPTKDKTKGKWKRMHRLITFTTKC